MRSFPKKALGVGYDPEIEAVLSGRPMEANTQHQFINLEDIAQIARRVHTNLGWDWYDHPAVLAELLGIKMYRRFGLFCDAMTDSRTMLAFKHSDDPREVAHRILHELSHVMFEREAWGWHSESDVYVLTAELGAPRWAFREYGRKEVEQCSSLPVWMIRAWAKAVQQEEAVA